MSNLRVAQDVHHRFEFYIVALAFTTAAFATQTGEFTHVLTGNVIEVLSWVTLVISGVLGLTRIQYLPVAYRINDAIQGDEQSIRELEDDEEHHDAVSAMRNQVAQTDSQLKKIEGRNRTLYVWQMGLLVAGFGLLVTARVITQVAKHY